MGDQANILVVKPTYDGRCYDDVHQSLRICGMSCNVVNESGSLLGHVFNQGFTKALAGNYTHMAMLHSDVAPERNWLRTLLQEMDRVDADVLSVVIPIKDETGDTSTAIAMSDGKVPVRLGLVDALSYPTTFNANDVVAAWKLEGAGPLLVNTGCMLMNMKKDWVRHWRGFHIVSGVHDGAPKVVSEDWMMSFDADAAGAMCYATTKVKLRHIGDHQWSNSEPFGRRDFSEEEPATVDPAVIIERVPKGALGVEVGVWRGQTSELLLRGRKDLKLALVDPWTSNYDQTKFGQTDARQMIANYEDAMYRTSFGRRLTLRCTSAAAKGSFQDEALDFAFIDANHAYDFVSADIGYWWPKIKSGGFLACHDYSEGDPGVIKAVDEFLELNGLEAEVKPLPGADDTTAIIRKP